MKRFFISILLLFTIATAFGQPGQPIGSPATTPYARSVDHGGTLPASCGTGDLYYKTGASAGLYNCNANTWALSAATATKTSVGLSNVENTALSTWVGTANITTLGTIGTGTWNATAIGATKGGTGLTGITVGQIPYGSGTDTYSALPADTSNVRKFLRTLSIKAAGQAPAWDTVTATDVGLGSVENTALSTWAGTSSITTLGTIGTGSWHSTTIDTDHGGTGETSYFVWTNVPYNAANFTARDSMTWTVEAGDQIGYSYTIAGKTMFLNAVIFTSTVGGTLANKLYLAIPASKSAAAASAGTFWIADNNVAGMGVYSMAVNDTVVTLQTIAGGNLTASTDLTIVRLSIVFAIN